MKKLFNYLLALATLGLGMAACEPTPDEPEKITPNYPTITVVEEVFDIYPGGTDEQPTTYDIEAEGAWKIEPAEDYDWIEITPAEGEGNAELTISARINESGKERSAEFVVKESIMPENADKLGAEAEAKEITTYSFFVTQKKLESNLGDGTYEFIQAVVNGKLLGDKTPEVTNWYNVDITFPGITMENIEGKLHIVALSGTDFVGMPEDKLDLPELTNIGMRGANMKDKRLPKEWNTPKLTFCNFALCGLTGLIPEGLATTTPNLIQLFLDQNNFYGSLPHDWAAGINTIEVVILNNHSNKDVGTKYYDSKDNSALGYLVPKSLDVRMNAFDADGNKLNGTEGSTHKQGDYTQLKLGGVFEGNYVGYEAGWGQHRVEAANDDSDEYTWTVNRTLWDSPFGHSNMGYPDKMQAIPPMMCDWDEAAADAWDKQARDLNTTRLFPNLGTTAAGE